MTTPLIRVGPRNGRTDPESGLRLYTWRGVEYPSVTSVRRLAGMPHGLANWYQTKIIDRVISEYPSLSRQMGDGTDPKAIATWLRKAPTQERDAAGDLGTRVHDAAEKGLSLAQAGEDVAPFLAQYLSFLASTGCRVVAKERQVWNLSVGYAGTFDFIANFGDSDEYWMVDLKTGKGTYPEHACQLEAYRRAEFIGADDIVDDDATAILKRVTKQGVLHLRPEGWTFKAIPPSDKTWVAFRGLLAFGRWTMDNPTLDTLISATRTGSASISQP